MYGFSEANILYIESPAPVGFSYMSVPLEVENHGDFLTAENNYIFLVNWLKRFPEYKEREVYIAGQSYAGHYGPQLAEIILQRNNQTFINLRGLLLGNPGLDDTIELTGNMQYLLDHAMISQDMLAKHKRLCGTEFQDAKQVDQCLDIMRKIQDSEKNINMYSIYSPLCHNSTLTNKPKNCTTIMKFDPCSPHYVTSYLNDKEVQIAMHANTTNVPYPWMSCSDSLKMVYNMNEVESTVPLLKNLMEEGLRVWVYSGDVDSVVSVTGTLYVLKAMNLTVEKSWRAWFSEGEVGGFTEDYNNNLKFVSVKGAGHSVPSDQPIRALTLFSSFVRNTLPETI